MTSEVHHGLTELRGCSSQTRVEKFEHQLSVVPVEAKPSASNLDCLRVRVVEGCTILCTYGLLNLTLQHLSALALCKSKCLLPRMYALTCLACSRLQRFQHPLFLCTREVIHRTSSPPVLPFPGPCPEKPRRLISPLRFIITIIIHFSPVTVQA